MSDFVCGSDGVDVTWQVLCLIIHEEGVKGSGTASTAASDSVQDTGA